MTAQLSPTPVQKFFDANGLPLVSGKVFTYIAGTSTKQASYIDSLQVTPNTNPVILNARGECVLWLDPSKSYKIVLAPATDTDPPTNAIWTSDNILGPFTSATNIIPSIDNTFTLGSPSVSWANVYVGVNHAAVLDTVSGNIGYYARTQAEITALVVPTNQVYVPGHAWRYGADPTGVINATTALLNMYKVCIGDGVNTGIDGYIPPGTYKVTTGVLIFDNGFVKKAWPNIRTGGYRQTIFMVDAATATNAPILQWKNGTASGSSGNYWYGGSHEGVTFQDITGATAALRSGIAMTGVWGTRFGYMYGITLRGDLLTIPLNLFGGTNPDPYAVTNCYFQALDCLACQGYGINNLNYVGFVGNDVKSLTVTQSGLGGWFGLGSLNTCKTANIQNGMGWAFDDGTLVDHTGGSSSKFTLVNGEIDNQQKGISLNACLSMNILSLRVVHRFQTSPNVAAVYWPTPVVQMAAGAAASVQEVNMLLTHRLNAGGAHANIGVWNDFTNAGGAIQGVNIETFVDNQTSGAITILDSDLFSNLTANSFATITALGRRVADTQIKVTACYFGDGTTQVSANGNYGTAAAKVLFPVKDYDIQGYVATSVFTVPFTGPYEIRVRFCLTAAAGTKVQLGIFKNGATTVMDSKQYASTATVQSYEVTGILQLIQADTLYVIADNSTGAAIVCNAPIAQSADNIFQVRAL